MNPNVLRHQDFWTQARGASEQPHGIGPSVLADWLDEHDSPIRAYLLRYGVPEHQVADRGAGVEQTWQPNNPALPVAGVPDQLHIPSHESWPGVIFKDEGANVRRLEGETRIHRRPLAEHHTEPESFELFVAAPLSGHGPERYAVRYTIHLGRRHLRLIAPVGSEHVQAIGDAIGDHLPERDNEQDRLRYLAAVEFQHQAQRMRFGEHVDHAHELPRPSDALPPVTLARIRVMPGRQYGQPFGGGAAMMEHEIHDEEAGKKIGILRIQPRNDGKMLHVNWVGRDDAIEGEDSNSLGAGEIARALHQIGEHYPEAEFISGIRGGHSGFRGTGNAERVVVPIRRRKLARQVYRAPIGGAVSTLYHKGGQFVAKARQRIRDVAARLVKLARPEGHDNYVRAILDAPKEDGISRATFADFLETHGLPGAHVVRQHANRLLSGKPVLKGRLSSPYPADSLLLLGPTPRIVNTGVRGKGTYGALRKEELLERPVVQSTWGSGIVRIAVAHHQNTTPTAEEKDRPRGTLAAGRFPVVHHADATSPEELEGLIADFPEWAKVYFRGEPMQHLRETADPTKLARGDAKTRGTDLLGAGESPDTPLTLGQLKAIEEAHALPQSHRLSPSAVQPALASGDEHPYSVTIGDAVKFLGHLSRSAIGPGKLKKILLSPKVDDRSKITHRTTQLLGDYTDAPKGDWYSGAVDALDRGIHHKFGIGKLDASGSLIGKGAPHEHHPELVLFKVLLGLTSPLAKTVDNTRHALGMWNTGVRRAQAAGSDDPLAHIPPRNDDALQDWLHRLNAIHGQTVPPPGVTPAERAKWYAKWVEPKEGEVGVGEGKVGYSTQEARVFFHNDPNHLHHGVLRYLIGPNGKPHTVNRAAPVPSRTTAEAKNVPLPLTNSDGTIKAKGWGKFGNNTALGLARLKKIVDRFRTPDGGTKQAYRDAAKWLFEFHRPEEFTEEERKRVYSGGFYGKDEPAPGFFVFGPKIGAFMANLHANDPATRQSHGAPFTHDTWMQRMLLTHLGRLTTDEKSKNVSPTDRKVFRTAIDSLAHDLGRTAAELQADLWYYAQGLTRRLGVPGKRIESLSFRDAANRLLPVKNARPGLHESLATALGGKTWKRHSKRTAIQKHVDGSISVMQHGKKMVTAHPDGTVKKHGGKFYAVKLARALSIVQPGETPYAALDRILGTRNTRKHGKNVRILRGPDDDIHVRLYGYPVVIAHPNGQVTLNVPNGQKSPTVRRMMEGFSGHSVSFAGGQFAVNGQPYENNTPYPPAQAAPVPTRITIPHTDLELQSFFDNARPSQHVEHGVAGALADWLEEHNDWRHHLLRNTADWSPNIRGYVKPDGTGVSPGWFGGSGTFRVEHERVKDAAFSRVVWTANPHQRLFVIETEHPTERGRNTIGSVLTPEQYDTMRAEAATAGVHFPEAPK